MSAILPRALAALLLALSPAQAFAQAQDSAGPAPAAGSPPQPAPLGGCVYMPNGVGPLTGYVGPMGLTCDAIGGLRVSIVAGGNSGGGTSGSVYGPTAEGTAPANPPIYNGYKDAAGLTRGASPTTQLPTQTYDQRGSGTIDSTKTSGSGSFVDISLNDAGTVGLTFTGLAASGATASYFITNTAGNTPAATISSFNAATGQPSATRTTDGETRIAVGGHATLRIQNTTAGTGSYTVGYNVSAATSIVDVRSPITLFQNYAALSATNGLPINNAQWAGVALGAPTAYGTAPTGNVPGMNAAVTNFPATQNVNNTQVSGTAIATGSGASNAGTQRTILATDQPAVPVTGTFFQSIQPVSPTSAANALGNPFFVQQSVGGAAAATGTGASNAQTPRVAVSTDSLPQTAPGTSAAAALGIQGVTGGVPVPVSGTFFQTTQPVSGTVTANQGTPGGTAWPVDASGTNLTVRSSALAGSGGVVNFSRVPSSAASTNATTAKTTTGRLYKVIACNTTTTAARIKFYNSATTPTPGTTTVLFSRPIPPASAAGGLNCVSYDQADIGWSFSVGISYALVTGAADTDATAVAAGAITDVSVEYQ